ncbi:MAG TPA: Asp-tRNA(Asn)/Glu-tRNA(Gln) amidotransferase subunit GatA [Vicinamibacterales bacterium]|nr:Asp-tRNA(Asn)/Glu-tRNA(Gln) amidotransferase subunit GatA [Vicinamibacterales bacterium]
MNAVTAVEQALARLTSAEPKLSAFNTVTAERALDRARALDAAPSGGLLHGIPVALKDNMCTAGVPTTASSKILSGFVPPYDATVVKRLEAAGAIIIGKTNLDEFAMGSSTENSALGSTKNPWDLTRTPGGSSGGSAAAVAARVVPIALGSDTGGSIRQPAALCGITGMKPTYGRVSRYGLLAFASSLDQIGPFTITAADAARVLQVIGGFDARDSTSAPEPLPDLAAALTGDVKGLRIGVPRAFVGEGVDAAVLAAFEAALRVFTARGATIVDIELPHAGYGIPIYYLICTAEASSNLARYDGVRYGHRARLQKDDTLQQMYERTRDEGFGPEVKRRIMLGTYVLSAGYYDAYYLKAQQVRTLVRRDYDRAFEAADVVATPTTPTPAFKLGEKTSDPVQMYLNDIFTVSANLTGLPSISVPCGFAPSGARGTGTGEPDAGSRLPIGFQLTGRAFDEATLLRAADAFQRDTTFHLEVPALAEASTSTTVMAHQPEGGPIV